MSEFESSKHKKHDQIWAKITTPQSNNHEKTNKKEGNLPKPLPSFSFFRPLLTLLPTTIYINKKLKIKLLADVSVLFQHPIQG